MPKIMKIRPVLLSAPYANERNAEVAIHLPQGYRTCSLVELTLDNGVTGLGEGYLGVFAPRVFREIVELVAPYLIGEDIMQTNLIYRKVCDIVGYWSFQGAARHVVSAIEIAAVDAKAKVIGIPAYDLFGGTQVTEIPVYGSGGDSRNPEEMEKEFQFLHSLGIRKFKIRARNYEPYKAAWCLERGRELGICVAVDMAQNLATPGQSVCDVVEFLQQVQQLTHEKFLFLEEALGCLDTQSYPILRSKVDVPICGGEVVTTSTELCSRVSRYYYDFVQPDATVIGGMGEVNKVFAACFDCGSRAVVHCWGGAVCMMANYHIAFANGAELVEYPMPDFPIRRDLMAEPLTIRDGKLQLPTAPGLGVVLTPELEEKYPFREDALYNCIGNVQAACNDQAYQKAFLPRFI